MHTLHSMNANDHRYSSTKPGKSSSRIVGYLMPLLRTV